MKKKISSIKTHPAQADIYNVSPQSVKSLADNIDKLGQLEPLIITPQNILLSGYTRLEALKLLGKKTAEVKVVDVPEAEQIFFLISANKQRVKDYVCRLAEADALTEYYSKGQGHRSDIKDQLVSSERTGRRKSTIQLVAAELGMSTKTIQQLRYIQSQNPELLQHIGKHITLASCYAQVKMFENQEGVIKSAKKPGKKKIVGDNYVIHRRPAEEVAKIIEEGTIDVVLTSPPYYQQRQYIGGGSELGAEKSVDEFIDNLVSIFGQCAKVLKPTGSMLININDSYRDGALQQVPFRLSIALADKLGLILRNTIIWDKQNKYSPESTKRRRHTSHDYIFHFVKDASAYYYDIDKVRKPYTASAKQGGLTTGSMPRWVNISANGKAKKLRNQSRTGASIQHPLGRMPGSVIYHHNNMQMVGEKGELIEHTSPFPIELVEELLAPVVKANDIVLDPFSGSGTTGVVAIKMGAKYIGMEINSAFVELSQKKIEKSI